jgi:hypothetical protein
MRVYMAARTEKLALINFFLKQLLFLVPEPAPYREFLFIGVRMM